VRFERESIFLYLRLMREILVLETSINRSRKYAIINKKNYIL